MTISFDSTIGGASANSYSTILEYIQYRENHGISPASITDDVARVQLIVATTWLDNYYRNQWKTQAKTADTQALHWPQSGATLFGGTSIDDDVIPAQVKEAVWNYAISREAEAQTSIAPVDDSNSKRQKLAGVGEIEKFSRTSGFGLPDTFKFIDTILTGLINSVSGLNVLNLYRY